MININYLVKCCEVISPLTFMHSRMMIKDMLDYGDAFAECNEVGVFGVQNNHSLSGCTSGTVECVLNILLPSYFILVA